MPNWVIDGWGILCEINIRLMSLDLNDEKSTLAQAMAWCLQAIIWVIVDPVQYPHNASLGHNELTRFHKWIPYVMVLF